MGEIVDVGRHFNKVGGAYNKVGGAYNVKSSYIKEESASMVVINKGQLGDGKGLIRDIEYGVR